MNNDNKQKNNKTEYNKRYYMSHKEQFKKIAAEYYPKHLKQIKKQQRRYYRDHREKLKAYKRKWYIENRDRALQYAKEYGKIYYQKNKDFIAIRDKKYRQTEHGKEIRKKNEIIRRGKLGFNKIFENIIDEQICWHHVDNKNVVAIPRDIHEMYYNGTDTSSHRENLSYVVQQLYPSIYFSEP